MWWQNLVTDSTFIKFDLSQNNVAIVTNKDVTINMKLIKYIMGDVIDEVINKTKTL